MHGDGERLDHRAFVEAHLRTELCHLLRIDREILASRSCRLKAHHLQLFAEVVLAVPTRMAIPADDLRLDRHLLAHGEAVDSRTTRGDFARHLVSLRDGIARERVLAVPHVYVRPAYADAADSHKDFASTRFRTLHLAERYLARRRHDLLQHLHFLFASSSSIILE